ncbi:MAG: SusD/RagB family nutrient-binding outer membrane lipoprotein [Bacteroidales bacterium]|nr:SusD/RagB family nutrient-binding outer membrane lipoprotein [Bacteroidales bacterium]
MKKIILSILSLLVLVTSCQDFEELEKDPNRPTNVPPSLVFSSILDDLYREPWTDAQKWNQFWCSNYNYYGTQEYNWTNYSFSFTTLKNVVKMEDEALKTGAKENNAYSALGKFFRAYFFTEMTLLMGDIPMTEALKGLENKAPKYDAQKQVFIGVLQLLEDCNNNLATIISEGGAGPSGDFMLGGDLKKWQKVVNAYTLRVLMHLSKKENDADLNIKQKFAAIVNNPAKYPLMEGMGDNLQYVYNSINKYPNNQDNYGFNATRRNMSATYLNTLAALKDPRTFVVADPAPAKIAAGLAITDFEAYVGASSGEGLDDMSTKALKGEYSWISKSRYYSTYTGEPCMQIGYPEMCFNIAEAINRGWASGDAETWYKKGITASVNFYGISDAATLETYLNQVDVKYAGNNNAGLNQILTQKYLAFFNNSGWEAFFNYRRTGVPTFLTGPGTGNSGRIPKRWQYPLSERTTNEANYKAALKAQFDNETDDINSNIWIMN